MSCVRLVRGLTGGLLGYWFVRCHTCCATHQFGVEEDLQLGAQIVALILERSEDFVARKDSGAIEDGCDENGCRI